MTAQRDSLLSNNLSGPEPFPILAGLPTIFLARRCCGGVADLPAILLADFPIFTSSRNFYGWIARSKHFEFNIFLVIIPQDCKTTIIQGVHLAK